MKRTPLRRTARKTRFRDTGPSPAVRRMVAQRAGWACERCGRSATNTGADVHHRRARGMGGTSNPEINSLSNLVLLCRPCHQDVESNRLMAVGMGWLVTGRLDPADVAVRVGPMGYVFLTADGNYAVSPPSAVR